MFLPMPVYTKSFQFWQFLEWANSTAVEMDWNRLQKRTFLDRLRGISDVDPEDETNDHDTVGSSIQKLRNFISRKQEQKRATQKIEESRVEFFVTEGVERQIELGENLLEIGTYCGSKKSSSGNHDIDIGKLTLI